MTNKQILLIGIGKMGLNMAERLKEHQYDVIGFAPSDASRKLAEEHGLRVVHSISEGVTALSAKKTVWLMVPHSAVDEVLRELVPLLQVGDTVIDGGNSPYKESQRRAKELALEGVRFLDAGVSGGPSGARNGACIMVGGMAEVYAEYEELFRDLSAPEAYIRAGESGAGHFVKMVHNGIEYGMMQAIAEGFGVMKASPFNLDLQSVAGLYNHQSVITSRLTGWLEGAYAQYGTRLDSVSGTVAHTGEGAWTIEAAHELGVAVPIIEGSLEFRKQSVEHPSYTGQVLSALRNQFGGHDIGGPRK